MKKIAIIIASHQGVAPALIIHRELPETELFYAGEGQENPCTSIDSIPAFIVLNVIVFTETGLLIGFFLPGDSLLVLTGFICANENCAWNIPLLLVTLSLSAIVGDTVGYWIGYKSGPKIFNREK